MTSNCKVCRKIIVKPGGLLWGSHWYCSTRCHETDPQVIAEESCTAGETDTQPAHWQDHEPDQDPDETSDVEDADLNFDELLN